MIIEIFKEQDMSDDIESGWTPLIIEHSIHNSKKFATSLQLSWKELQGSRDSVIEILTTNSTNAQPFSDTFYIPNDTNDSGGVLFVIPNYFKYIKIKFTANNLTAGLLDAVLFYS